MVGETQLQEVLFLLGEISVSRVALHLHYLQLLARVPYIKKLEQEVDGDRKNIRNNEQKTGQCSCHSSEHHLKSSLANMGSSLSKSVSLTISQIWKCSVLTQVVHHTIMLNCVVLI